MKNIREFSLETKKNRIAFLPGDLLRGELYICLEEPTDIKSLKIFLHGEAGGEWLAQAEKSQIKGDSYKPRVLVDIGLLVFGFANENSSDQTETHECGRFVYDFEFNIPSNLPSSFKSPADKDLGFAKYSLKAVLSRPKKYDKVKKFSIIINELIDPDRPELIFQPGSYEDKNVRTALMPCGSLALESYLNRSQYVQGESILINAVAQNKSSKLMKEVYAKLIRRIRCKSRFGTNTFTVDTTSVQEGKLAAHGRLEWKSKEMRIPAVGPTVSGNEDIRVDYIVRVGMYEELGSELHLDLPVIIGTMGKRDGEFEPENDDVDVYDRQKKQYGMQLIKSGDRGKFREALQAKFDASDHSMEAFNEDMKVKGSIVDAEINIATEEELFTSYDDDFLASLDGVRKTSFGKRGGRNRSYSSEGRGRSLTKENGSNRTGGRNVSRAKEAEHNSRRKSRESETFEANRSSSEEVKRDGRIRNRFSEAEHEGRSRSQSEEAMRDNESRSRSGKATHNDRRESRSGEILDAGNRFIKNSTGEKSDGIINGTERDIGKYRDKNFENHPQEDTKPDSSKKKRLSNSMDGDIVESTNLEVFANEEEEDFLKSLENSKGCDNFVLDNDQQRSQSALSSNGTNKNSKERSINRNPVLKRIMGYPAKNSLSKSTGSLSDKKNEGNTASRLNWGGSHGRLTTEMQQKGETIGSLGGNNRKILVKEQGFNSNKNLDRALERSNQQISEERNQGFGSNKNLTRSLNGSNHHISNEGRNEVFGSNKKLSGSQSGSNQHLKNDNCNEKIYQSNDAANITPKNILNMQNSINRDDADKSDGQNWKEVFDSEGEPFRTPPQERKQLESNKNLREIVGVESPIAPTRQKHDESSHLNEEDFLKKLDKLDNLSNEIVENSLDEQDKYMENYDIGTHKVEKEVTSRGNELSDSTHNLMNELLKEGRLPTENEDGYLQNIELQNDRNIGGEDAYYKKQKMRNTDPLCQKQNAILGGKNKLTKTERQLSDESNKRPSTKATSKVEKTQNKAGKSQKSKQEDNGNWNLKGFVENLFSKSKDEEKKERASSEIKVGEDNDKNNKSDNNIDKTTGLQIQAPNDILARNKKTTDHQMDCPSEIEKEKEYREKYLNKMHGNKTAEKNDERPVNVKEERDVESKMEEEKFLNMLDRDQDEGYEDIDFEGRHKNHNLVKNKRDCKSENDMESNDLYTINRNGPFLIDSHGVDRSNVSGNIEFPLLREDRTFGDTDKNDQYKNVFRNKETINKAYESKKAIYDVRNKSTSDDGRAAIESKTPTSEEMHDERSRKRSEKNISRGRSEEVDRNGRTPLGEVVHDEEANPGEENSYEGSKKPTAETRNERSKTKEINIADESSTPSREANMYVRNLPREGNNYEGIESQSEDACRDERSKSQQRKSNDYWQNRSPSQEGMCDNRNRSGEGKHDGRSRSQPEEENSYVGSKNSSRGAMHDGRSRSRFESRVRDRSRSGEANSYGRRRSSSQDAIHNRRNIRDNGERGNRTPNVILDHKTRKKLFKTQSEKIRLEKEKNNDGNEDKRFGNNGSLANAGMGMNNIEHHEKKLDEYDQGNKIIEYREDTDEESYGNFSHGKNELIPQKNENQKNLDYYYHSDEFDVKSSKKKVGDEYNKADSRDITQDNNSVNRYKTDEDNKLTKSFADSSKLESEESRGRVRTRPGSKLTQPAINRKDKEGKRPISNQNSKSPHSNRVQSAKTYGAEVRKQNKIKCEGKSLKNVNDSRSGSFNNRPQGGKTNKMCNKSIGDQHGNYTRKNEHIHGLKKEKKSINNNIPRSQNKNINVKKYSQVGSAKQNQRIKPHTYKELEPKSLSRGIDTYIVGHSYDVNPLSNIDNIENMGYTGRPEHSGRNHQNTPGGSEKLQYTPADYSNNYDYDTSEAPEEVFNKSEKDEQQVYGRSEGTRNEIQRKKRQPIFTSEGKELRIHEDTKSDQKSSYTTSEKNYFQKSDNFSSNPDNHDGGNNEEKNTTPRNRKMKPKRKPIFDINGRQIRNENSPENFNTTCLEEEEECMSEKMIYEQKKFYHQPYISKLESNFLPDREKALYPCRKSERSVTVNKSYPLQNSISKIKTNKKQKPRIAFGKIVRDEPKIAKTKQKTKPRAVKGNKIIKREPSEISAKKSQRIVSSELSAGRSHRTPYRNTKNSKPLKSFFKATPLEKKILNSTNTKKPVTVKPRPVKSSKLTKRPSFSRSPRVNKNSQKFVKSNARTTTKQSINKYFPINYGSNRNYLLSSSRQTERPRTYPFLSQKKFPKADKPRCYPLPNDSDQMSVRPIILSHPVQGTAVEQHIYTGNRFTDSENSFSPKENRQNQANKIYVDRSPVVSQSVKPKTLKKFKVKEIKKTDDIGNNDSNNNNYKATTSRFCKNPTDFVNRAPRADVVTNKVRSSTKGGDIDDADEGYDTIRKHKKRIKSNNFRLHEPCEFSITMGNLNQINKNISTNNQFIDGDQIDIINEFENNVKAPLDYNEHISFDDDSLRCKNKLPTHNWIPEYWKNVPNTIPQTNDNNILQDVTAESCQQRNLDGQRWNQVQCEEENDLTRLPGEVESTYEARENESHEIDELAECENNYNINRTEWHKASCDNKTKIQSELQEKVDNSKENSFEDTFWHKESCNDREITYHKIGDFEIAYWEKLKEKPEKRELDHESKQKNWHQIGCWENNNAYKDSKYTSGYRNTECKDDPKRFGWNKNDDTKHNSIFSRVMGGNYSTKNSFCDHNSIQYTIDDLQTLYNHKELMKTNGFPKSRLDYYNNTDKLHEENCNRDSFNTQKRTNQFNINWSKIPRPINNPLRDWHKSGCRWSSKNFGTVSEPRQRLEFSNISYLSKYQPHKIIEPSKVKQPLNQPHERTESPDLSHSSMTKKHDRIESYVSNASITKPSHTVESKDAFYSSINEASNISESSTTEVENKALERLGNQLKTEKKIDDWFNEALAKRSKHDRKYKSCEVVKIGNLSCDKEDELTPRKSILKKNTALKEHSSIGEDELKPRQLPGLPYKRMRSKSYETNRNTIPYESIGDKTTPKHIYRDYLGPIKSYVGYIERLDASLMNSRDTTKEDLDNYLSENPDLNNQLKLPGAPEKNDFLVLPESPNKTNETHSKNREFENETKNLNFENPTSWNKLINTIEKNNVDRSDDSDYRGFLENITADKVDKNLTEINCENQVRRTEIFDDKNNLKRHSGEKCLKVTAEATESVERNTTVGKNTTRHYKNPHCREVFDKEKKNSGDWYKSRYVEKTDKTIREDNEGNKVNDLNKQTNMWEVIQNDDPDFINDRPVSASGSFKRRGKPLTPKRYFPPVSPLPTQISAERAELKRSLSLKDFSRKSTSLSRSQSAEPVRTYSRTNSPVKVPSFEPKSIFKSRKTKAGELRKSQSLNLSHDEKIVVYGGPSTVNQVKKENTTQKLRQSYSKTKSKRRKNKSIKDNFEETKQNTKKQNKTYFELYQRRKSTQEDSPRKNMKDYSNLLFENRVLPSSNSCARYRTASEPIRIKNRADIFSRPNMSTTAWVNNDAASPKVTGLQYTPVEELTISPEDSADDEQWSQKIQEYLNKSKSELIKDIEISCGYNSTKPNNLYSEAPYGSFTTQDDNCKSELTRMPPKSAVRPLKPGDMISEVNNQLKYKNYIYAVPVSNNTDETVSEKRTTSLKNCNTQVEKVSRSLVSKRGKRLEDSFDQHEKSLGIIDESGNFRTNKQLVDQCQKKAEEERRLKKIQRRKHERFLKDLKLSKLVRCSSCPNTLGVREPIVEYHMYKDVTGSETGTEYTTESELSDQTDSSEFKSCCTHQDSLTTCSASPNIYFEAINENNNAETPRRTKYKEKAE